MPRMPLRSTTLAFALAGLAGPALAQDGLCGGSGVGGQWIGGAEAESDITSADSYREQMALVMGGNEYVALFTVSDLTDVRVEAEGRGAGDPIIDLLDETGAVVLSDDDSGGNAAARGEATLEPGTYCMALRSYDGGPMTAFVRIGRTEQPPLTAGIDASAIEAEEATLGCAAAIPLGPIGSTVSASVDETPFWSFTLDTPTAVSITATNEDADPVLKIYDANETMIHENDDFDGLNSRLDISAPLDAGTYCIGLDALNDTSLPITVSLTAYDAEAALAALYAQGDAAPPLDGSVPITDLGVLGSQLRQDVRADSSVTWFQLEVTESSLLLVEAIAAGGSDPWLVVYDDLGRQVGLNDDYGQGLDSLVTARANPGIYLVGVKEFGEGQGFVRLVIERYVRAQ